MISKSPLSCPATPGRRHQGLLGPLARRAARREEARRLQFALLELFVLMVGAPNFPEGFRAGYELRGRLACVLADSGFPEAAALCRRQPGAPAAAAPPTVAAADCEALRRRLAALGDEVFAARQA